MILRNLKHPPGELVAANETSRIPRDARLARGPKTARPPRAGRSPWGGTMPSPIRVTALHWPEEVSIKA